jgi:hypothetical protein
MGAQELSVLKGSPVVSLYLEGDAYDPLGAAFPKDPGPYQTDNPAVIRLFLDYLARRTDTNPAHHRMDDIGSTIILVTADKKEHVFVVSAFSRDMKDARYRAAEAAMVQELLRQTRAAADRLRRAEAAGQVSEVLVTGNMSKDDRSFLRTKDRKDIRELIDALYRLDERAFTFGNIKQTGFVNIVFLVSSGKGSESGDATDKSKVQQNEIIRLRLQKLASVAEARRMRDPPLPPALWRRLYPQP